MAFFEKKSLLHFRLESTMHLLREEWENLGWETNHVASSIDLVDITQNSREVQEGWFFFALDGSTYQGKNFVPEVLKKKPSAIFLDKKYQEEFKEELKKSQTGVVFFFSSDFIISFKQTLFILFGNALKSITLFGVTGTNGKTTIAFLLKNLVESLGAKSMYIGTLGAIIRDKQITQEMTTPDIVSLYRLIHRGVQEKVSFAFLEVSSHALEQGRIAGLNFFIGAFTNLSHDHLDYHKNIEAYYQSKKLLFQNMLAQKKSKHPHFVICIDDIYGQKLANWLNEEPSPKKVFTFSLEKKCDLQILNIHTSSLGHECTFLFQQETYCLKTQLLGTFNLQNLACVFLTAYILGFPPRQIIKKIKNLSAVKGRMEPVFRERGRLIIIDYAHTPEALKQALSNLRKLNFKRLQLVFGCGGNRDQEKRMLMGKVASELADEFIITNDNPREEDPMKIAKEIEKGCKESGASYQILLDRETAIQQAIAKLSKKEILLIAGKGHENYQIIKNKKTYVNDHDIVRQAVKKCMI